MHLVLNLVQHNTTSSQQYENKHSVLFSNRLCKMLIALCKHFWTQKVCKHLWTQASTVRFHKQPAMAEDPNLK